MYYKYFKFKCNENKINIICIIYKRIIYISIDIFVQVIDICL